MNPLITYALIFWTLLLAAFLFCAAISLLAQSKNGPSALAGALSFLSLFTALLAIGSLIPL